MGHESNWISISMSLHSLWFSSNTLVPEVPTSITDPRNPDRTLLTPSAPGSCQPLVESKSVGNSPGRDRIVRKQHTSLLVPPLVPAAGAQ